jgi:N-acetylmuramoyl-L-alanine amidase
MNDMSYNRIVISSGHSLKVRGASGVLDEVDEARKVVDRLATELLGRGVDVTTYHDDVSTSQNENLNRIVDFHNSRTRELDVSVHFNAYVETDKPMGTECLFVTQSALAAKVSAAIANAGDFIDRGAKKRTDLFFLNNTAEPAILIEVCFVDSSADAQFYQDSFELICDAIADVLGGPADVETEPPPGETVPPEAQKPTVRFDVEVTGDVAIIVNGVPVT